MGTPQKCSFEEIHKVALNKTAVVWPLTSHLTSHFMPKLRLVHGHLQKMHDPVSISFQRHLRNQATNTALFLLDKGADAAWSEGLLERDD